jgi:hypothetical protein
MTSLLMKIFPSSPGDKVKKAWRLTGRCSWIIRARRRYNVAQTNMGEMTMREEEVA